ncbi:unnamed protein product [Orchesella dallaii]|uniref:Uncharacterized protein n=1 Tax=Orchesella dallaii TaxID=48710 RepID=A0ABP1PM39_9HEXA
MSVLEYNGNWLLTQIALLTHFRNLTVEFIWDEGNGISDSLFKQCLLLQCVNLNYHLATIDGKLRFILPSNDSNEIRWQSLQLVLQGNANAIRSNRYSSQEILLISDSKFPPNSGTNSVLQTFIPEWKHSRPFKLPAVIVSPSSLEAKNELSKPHRFLDPLLSKALLIFVGEDPDNYLSIGCFACSTMCPMVFENPVTKSLQVEFPISFENFPANNVLSVETMFKFWRKIHTSLHFDASVCSTNSAAPKSDATEETTETFKTYFQYSNCTDSKNCGHFFSTLLRLRRRVPIGFVYTIQIYPFGQNHNEYRFQIFTPNQKFLDANLTAFLTPFDISVWLSILAVILATSIWLIFKEEKAQIEVLFWQIRILFEENIELRKLNIFSVFLLIMWTYALILLRLCYNSSLYSFLTSEKDSYNYPHNIDDLIQSKTYGFLVPHSFYDELFAISVIYDKYLPGQLKRFYLKLMYNSAFIKTGRYMETFRNVSERKYVSIWYYVPDPIFKSRNIPEFLNTDRKSDSRKYSQFASLCQRDCSARWSLSSFGQTRFKRIVPQQKSFFNTFEFWMLRSPCFATVSFSKFFGHYVESGLYEFAINMFRKTELLRLMKRVLNVASVKFSNGTLVSYANLDENLRQNIKNEVHPTKLKAFIGTIVITAGIIGSAFIVLLCECIKAYYDRFNY